MEPDHARQLLSLPHEIGCLIVISTGSVYEDDHGRTLERSKRADDIPVCSPGFTQVGLADLALGPLGDNGGPTQTIALGSGSIAINAGNNAAAAGLTTDQRGRGFPRIVNGRVDIGAFEVRGRRSGTCLGPSKSTVTSPLTSSPAFPGTCLRRSGNQYF